MVVETVMTDESLENKVENEGKRGGFRKFLADSFASVTFSMGVGSAIEYFIAGLTVEQMLKSRGMATIVNVALGRPYGKFRDYVLRKIGVNEKSGFVKKALADIASFGSFWVPIYAGILYCAGADGKQIGAACITTTALSAFIGRPYGLYLDQIRGTFGVKPEYLDEVAK
jgi:hypothetical protein